MLRLIGEGSLATVFLAREIKVERLVALKVLKAALAADPSMRASFQKAALLAASIVHPNVSAIYRVGERADGLPYVAQEYIGGRTLADLLRSSDIRTVEESVRILASLAKALAAVADKRIVHGNIKPANVFIEQDTGRVVLTDCGFGETATGAGAIFSVGAIGYELLTGREPYEGTVRHESIPAVDYAGPPDIRSSRPEVPEPIAQLLKRCVQKNPDERPSAGELVRNLADDKHSEPPRDSTRLTQRAVESSLMRVAVIAGLVFMAMGAAVGLWLFVHYSQ